MDITSTKKRVTLREEYPNREFSDLRAQIQGIGEDTQWDARAKIMREFVESWEFKGDPKNIDSWGDLDFFDTQAIELAVVREILNPRAEYVKN